MNKAADKYFIKKLKRSTDVFGGSTSEINLISIDQFTGFNRPYEFNDHDIGYIPVSANKEVFYNTSPPIAIKN